MSSLHARNYCSDNPNALQMVLLHGWGMHSNAWQPMLNYLQRHFHLTIIDWMASDTLEQELLTLAPAQAIWCGWSLGGLVAVDIASRYPERVTAVITIASNPCFVSRADWPNAMPVADFNSFQLSLADNPLVMLKRFIALQCQGSASQRLDMRFLQAQLVSQSIADNSLLQQDLALLERDYRPQLAALSCPVLWLLGQQDALVPVAVKTALTAKSLQLAVIEQAAHVPFVSHPQTVSQHIIAFCQQVLL